jgi:sugar phosphate isomerase/epimerase
VNILLHTIALEPARWTPARVSRPLLELLPAIAASGFQDLEIYEPHLIAGENSEVLRSALAQHGLRPIILSSYLKVDPAVSSDVALEKEIDALIERIAFYGFRKVRLFPGPSGAAHDTFSDRIRLIARRMPEIELLLETHDGSLADDVSGLAQIVRDLGVPNVGLLYQPTVFEAEAALDQFRIQKSLIRHLHLQNRKADRSFATLEEGVIPWREIILSVGPKVDATLEFVPCGICPNDQFDLEAVLRQARAETDYVRGLLPR